ncbi:AMP-dependent synthetase [Solimonas sp. K1W22B-7]|uniref:class I adenylate-forming enzyme family protein n=1 Tax=Solimonas sp. K1W22B-7 TaxID=2303331 RepID=UPI000E337862|nr:fatty acid--CoA ligase family protein [Solimonas sp. K1W22B-7]AXQ30713.1 AMP-dependent synthetase [Solimonas sp. K1W22B-7]
MSALQDLVAAALARPASQPALEFEGCWSSWGHLQQLAGRVAALLQASGAASPAPVAFVPRNRPSSVAALLGLLAGGRSIRMIYAFQSTAAIARDLERLRPAAVVADAQDFSPEVRAVLAAQGSAAIMLTQDDATALPGLECSQVTSPAQASAQPQIEILTSGTTGPPKAFTISYELIARHLVGAPASDLSTLSPTLLFFPLGNISGIYSTLPALLRGQRAVLLERFSVAGWHDYVRRYRPKVSGLPPAGVQMVLDANIPVADLASIRRLGTGAAPLDPSVQRAFEERYGIPILLSYGATEFGGPVTAMTPELHAQWGQQKFGSVGRTLPGARLRIVDPDSGAVLPPGLEGLLEVISPRIGPDWIRTSDIAVIDEDGFLFHRGRADGAIMRGGFKLLPETIERALMLHPAISAVSVVGLGDTRLGQVPAAAIQLKPDVAPPSVAELEAHLRDQVYTTHIPVIWRFVQELPRTPSLKVDRPALRRLFYAE